MSKKRKTRKEKMITALRREVQLAKYSVPSANVPTYEFKKNDENKKESSLAIPATQSLSSRNYSYVISNTKKTLLITMIIFAAHVLFYLLLRNAVINLKFLGL